MSNLLKTLTYDQAKQCLNRRETAGPPPEVLRILADIRQDADAAVFRYARQLDGFQDEAFEVAPAAGRQAVENLDPELRRHLEEAIRRVRIMAEKQRLLFQDQEFELEGIRLGHRIMPLQRVACYAPGGRYPLPSSVIMGVIPARVAGVEEICVLSPRLHPVTIAAAVLAGADRIFNVGGAHGVAAAAYGLAGLPRADFIAGPGNRFVTAAKQLLYGQSGIDFPAGPSELLIIAGADANPAWIAADLLAQAEHDSDARPALITFSAGLVEAVNQELASQLFELPANSPARASLANGFAVVETDPGRIVELADAFAPEHLELSGSRAEALAPRFRHYGSLFAGALSAEVFGDYGSGTNHILPTAGAARFTGGVWVGTFLRVLTWQEVTPAALPAIARQAAVLAGAEGLPGHAASARIRWPGPAR